MFFLSGVTCVKPSGEYSILNEYSGGLDVICTLREFHIFMERHFVDASWSVPTIASLPHLPDGTEIQFSLMAGGSLGNEDVKRIDVMIKRSMSRSSMDRASELHCISIVKLLSREFATILYLSDNVVFDNFQETPEWTRLFHKEETPKKAEKGSPKEPGEGEPEKGTTPFD